MLTAAIVGAGLMGQWHARALARTGASLVLVVDSEESRARALARRFPGCRTDAGVDALHGVRAHVVHVCTPAGTHEPAVTAALVSGAHVLCEKPLAPDAASTGALLDLARTHGRLLCPVHQAPFQRGARAALRSLPRVGRIVHVQFEMYTAGARGRDEAGRDAVVAEILPHPLALLARILPAALHAEWDARRPQPGELRAHTSDAGVTASLVISTDARPTRNAAAIVGTQGTFHLDLFHGFATFHRGSTSRAHKIVQPFASALVTGGRAALNLAGRTVRRQPAYPGLWELVLAFYRAAEGLGGTPIPEEETLAVARAMDSILSRAAATTTQRAASTSS